MEFDEQMQARLATIPVPQTVGKAVGQTGKVAAGLPLLLLTVAALLLLWS